jgi:uncharacterized protein YjbI with pentapeptide repeats
MKVSVFYTLSWLFILVITGYSSNERIERKITKDSEFTGKSLRSYKYIQKTQFDLSQFRDISKDQFFHSGSEKLYFYSSQFKRTHIADAIYTGFYMHDTQFIQSSLTNTGFDSSSLQGLYFDKSSLKNITFIRSIITNITLNESKASNLFFFDSSVDKASKEQLNHIKTVYYSIADVEAAAAKKQLVEGPFFYKQRLTNTRFSGIHLKKASIQNSVFNNVLMREAKLSDSRVFFSRFYNLKAYKLYLENIDITQSVFENADFSSAKFVDVTIKNTTFKNCNFQKSDFKNVTLINCHFDDCKFKGNKQSKVIQKNSSGFKESL